MTSVAVLDYGAGNLGNARRAVAALGFGVALVRDAHGLPPDGPVLLPGVGAYGAAAARLRACGLDEAVRAAVASGRSVVGICLGMQLLFRESEEAEGTVGLGVLAGRVRRLRSEGRPLPHLGWCPVGARRTPYYFAHTYCVEPEDPGIVTATATWGETFPAMIRRANVVGFQFHPERSGGAGLALLDRTLRGLVAEP